jgi:predicted DCC family thiol-disulfide oxidoreductase YuxK
MGGSILVFDDDCGFCTWWAEFVAARSDVRLVGFSELDPDLRALLPDEYGDCSHLVTDDAVYSCGASIEEALARTASGSVVRPAVEFLRRVGVYRLAREAGYRWVAANRSALGKLFRQPAPARVERDADGGEGGGGDARR